MAIRKKQDPSEPIVFHRFAIDPKTHPLLHAHLLPLGLGKARVDYLRNHLEALLRGDFDRVSAAPGQGEESASLNSGNTAPKVEAEAPPVPESAANPPVAAEPEETEEEKRRRKEEAAILFRKSNIL